MQILLQTEHYEHTQVIAYRNSLIAVLYLDKGVARYTGSFRHLFRRQITP